MAAHAGEGIAGPAAHADLPAAVLPHQCPVFQDTGRPSRSP